MPEPELFLEPPTPEERLRHMQENTADAFIKAGLETAYRLGEQGEDHLSEDFILYHGEGQRNHLNRAFALGREARGAARSAAPEHTHLSPELELRDDFFEVQAPSATPEQERRARLIQEYREICVRVRAETGDDAIISNAFGAGELGDRERLEKFLRQDPPYARPSDIIAAYNLGAEMERRPHFVPPAAAETAHEAQPPQPEQSAPSEQQNAPAENPELEALLRTATNEQERDLMRQAHRLGVEDINYGRNNPEESSAFWNGEKVIALINAQGQEALRRLHDAFYAGDRWRRAHQQPSRPEAAQPPEPLEGQLGGSARETTTPMTEPAEASPIPAAAQAHAEPPPHPEPTAGPEAGTALHPESDESADLELARLEHDLNAARREYARLAVMAEKKERSSPRARTPADDGAPTPSGEGRPKIRINLLREDLASESAGKIRGAQKTYRDALNALRLYDARLLQENPAGLMPGELQKEAKKQFLAFTLREANRLYDEKTDISIAEKPQLARAAAEGIENLRRSPAGAKLIMSSGIFGGLSMIDFFAFLRGDLPLFTETGDPTGAQHALAGILLAKAGQSITKGYQKGKTRVEVGRAMRKEQREHNGDLLAALLDADNERLNDLMLAQAARKSDEKKKRAVAAAVSGLIGYMASSIFG